MKAFTLVTFVSLACIAVGIFNLAKSTEQPYNQRLQEIAKKVNSMNTTWRAALPHKLSDITTKVQAQKFLGAILEDKPSLPDVKHFHSFVGADIPDSYDPRDQYPNCSSLNEIRDQSGCGSCWAFGAAEAMSDRLCIHSEQKLQTRVSTEDLLSCCSLCGMGCNGGFPSSAWNYWVTTGLVSGDLYTNDQRTDSKTCKPYSFPPCAHHVKSDKYSSCNDLPDYATPKCTRECNSSYKTADYQSDKSFGQNAYSIVGEKDMMAELSTNGPIEVSVRVFEDFEVYSGGVYKHVTGEYLGGHAMKCIGYGTDSKTGQAYWLVTNSWNETWGEGGFIRILRGVNEIGIEENNAAGIPLIQ